MSMASQTGGGPGKITAAVRYIAESFNNLTQALSQIDTEKHIRIPGGTTYTVAPDDTTLIFTTGPFTLTLPSPSVKPGRMLYLLTDSANTVSSASANVVPLAGGAAGTAILAATAGKWAILQADSGGGVWRIIAAN